MNIVDNKQKFDGLVKASVGVGAKKLGIFDRLDNLASTFQGGKVIQINGYSFEGPYTTTVSLQDRAGIYAILKLLPNGNYSLVDVGESSQVKSRVATHDRALLWRQCSTLLFVAVLYTTGWFDFQRRAVESQIRQAYAPPCGER
jgi:hypothetical protein